MYGYKAIVARKETAPRSAVSELLVASCAGIAPFAILLYDMEKIH